MQKYGEVSWGEVQTDIMPSRENNKDTFLRLEKGANIVRIVTAPNQYSVHRYKKESDPGFGQRVMCAGKGPGFSCPLCDLGDKAKRRWLLGAIDRKTQTYKILDVGIAVLKAIQELTRDDEWGEPIKYDINIQVDPNGGATNYYHVTPKLPKPLSANDVQIRDTIDLEDLRRRCVPPTPERVQERLDKILNGTPATPARPAATAVANTRKASPAPVVSNGASSDDEEDPDLEFPKFQAQS